MGFQTLLNIAAGSSTHTTHHQRCMFFEMVSVYFVSTKVTYSQVCTCSVQLCVCACVRGVFIIMSLLRLVSRARSVARGQSHLCYPERERESAVGWCRLKEVERLRLSQNETPNEADGFCLTLLFLTVIPEGRKADVSLLVFLCLSAIC